MGLFTLTLNKVILVLYAFIENLIHLERSSYSDYHRFLECLVSYAPNYSDGKDFNPRRVPNTCEWFLNDSKLRHWKESNTAHLLWLSVSPGCGKSVLARTLIDDPEKPLQYTDNTTRTELCYFFFKEGDESRMHAINALCAILHQLLVSPDLTEAQIQCAAAAYSHHGDKFFHDFSKLWNLFVTCVEFAKSKHIVCVLDALDECDVNDSPKLIEKLKDLYCRFGDHSSTKSRLKFLITSRPYANLEMLLRNLDPAAYLRFDGDEKQYDLQREINLVIDDEMKKLDLSEQTNHRITEKLKSMQNRTYLWLHLTFSIIKENPTKYQTLAGLNELLSSLPTKVTDAYEQILSRSQNQEYTKALLQIVLVATRPLTLDEVNAALTLAVARLEGRSYDRHDDMKENMWCAKFGTTIKDLGGLFISVYGSKVLFIHQTAREFLITHKRPRKLKWQGQLNTNEAHSLMALVCLKYLSYLNYEQKLNREYNVRKIFPLLDYSVHNWECHARPAEEYVLQYIWHFLHLNKAFSNWCEARYQFLPEELDLAVTTLADKRYYYASKFGLMRTTDKLLSDEGYYMWEEYHQKRSPFRIACRYGYKGDVQRLLKDGVGATDENIASGVPLGDACFHGHKEIVQLLLENGFDANGGYHGSGVPLAAACQQGFQEIALLLLEKGADVDRYATAYGTPLVVACRWGFEQIVSLLLEKKADINKHDPKFHTPLIAACQRRHGNIVSQLLEKGADINKCVPVYGIPLTAACGWGFKDMVLLLLDKGAETNIYAPDYSTPLMVACQSGHEDIVELLFEKGAKIDKNDPRYGEILMTAYQRGFQTIVKLFQERGMDCNQNCIRTNSPFHFTSLSNRRNFKKRLLVDTPDSTTIATRKEAIEVVMDNSREKLTSCAPENPNDNNCHASFFNQGNSKRIPGDVSDSTATASRKEVTEVVTDSSDEKWTPCSFDNTNEKKNHHTALSNQRKKSLGDVPDSTTTTTRKKAIKMMDSPYNKWTSCSLDNTSKNYCHTSLSNRKGVNIRLLGNRSDSTTTVTLKKKLWKWRRIIPTKMDTLFS